MISGILPNIARHSLIGIVVIVGSIARFRCGRRFLVIHSLNFRRYLRLAILLNIRHNLLDLFGVGD
jgi:hypothetical protein